MKAMCWSGGGELASGAEQLPERGMEGGTTSGMLSTVTNISRSSSSRARWLSIEAVAGAGDVDDAFDAFVKFCKPLPADEIPESIDTVRGLPILVTPAGSVPTGLAFLATVA